MSNPTSKPHNYPSLRKSTGPRPQAGRPSTLKNPIRITITLEEVQKQFCLEQGELSQVIRTLIQEKMNLKIF